ncbi:MFS transporter [Leptospira johnsonii]|uniref:Transporter, major facilitator family protein n=1 Tax=Leptospira johnsonii TaxID=1917820 RepID=A0A2P2D7B8_9LEPT|nr:MFS transporter [Leptospira johnsonii]GBF40524.1 transporter, major facilitator family protein [Leptospira johnsonii]
MKEQTLTNRSMAGYASAEVGITAVETMAQIYLLDFYVSTVGLKPSLFGLAMLIAILWDAISDPIMGYISDHTSFAKGRRRPYILVGGFLLGLGAFFLFTPPDLETQTSKFLYLVLAYFLTNTFMTMIAVPHISLGGEIGFTSGERNRIFGWRLFFANLGLLSGLLLPAIWVSLGKDGFTSRSYSSASVWVLLCFVSYFSYFFTKGKDSPYRRTETEPVSIGENILSFFRSSVFILRNRYFLPLLLAFIVATAARTLNASLGLLYYKERLLLEDSQVVIRILLPFVFFLTISIPFWVYLAKKFGKKQPAFWGSFLLGVMTIVLYPILPQGSYEAPLIAAFLGGIFAGSILLFDSLVADVVDYDELLTGEKREGAYFGFWKMATKIIRAIGFAFLGFLLEAIGYQTGAQTQNPELGWRLTILFGPVVGGLFVLAALIFTRMELTGEVHSKIRELLSRKKNIQKRRSSGVSAG